MLPTEVRIPKIIEILKELEAQVGASENSEAGGAPSKTRDGRRTTSNAKATIKEIKSKDVSGRNNVDNVGTADTSKTKKSSKPSTKKKSIDLDNPCSSCPALSTKDERFVDGEGSGETCINVLTQIRLIFLLRINVLRRNNVIKY